jgi:T-complex protein 1 subunit alpha
MEGNETVDAKMFGEAECVEEKRVGDGELMYIMGCKNTRAQTIVLRGANDFMLDEIERSLHDCMMVVKRVLESKSVVPGGGCVEGALSVYMEHIADTMGSREQLAIAAFARAMLIIPKTLAVNG